ncbi:hypothetical protein [Pedobacter caeni]|uniref:Erythromycin esterase homolog n=1 Tax=Pedobacter caeni TaxID=288992 RepID=A0A1M5AT12_9SPHI|nr:hypothetical protein [Pedobacter caeni]SHF33344.1 hypothetical protein SAMN04488522_102875 [Pedobacter caeni]
MKLSTLPRLSFPFLFSFFAISSQAQTKDSLSLNSLIKKNTFNYNNGEFKGPGWDILKKEIQKVQFLMIGEQHGEAEIPVFTGKVAEILKPKAFVVEIDPYSAKRLKKVTANLAGDTEHFRKWPYDLSFFSWDAEMKLARKLIADKVDIWGLNEIAFMSNGLFFEELSAVSKIPANKKLAIQKSIEYGNHDRLLYTDIIKNWTNLSYYKMTPGSIDTLLYTFRNDNSQSKRMLLDLKASRPMLDGNHEVRLNLMKKNMMNYVSSYIGKDSINIPNLLFKFGANHVARTNDVNGYFEIGNLADHLAAAAGKKTLHILIFGKNGTWNDMRSIDNSISVKPYNVKEDPDLKVFKSFYDQVNDQEWAVFDLRPIGRAIENGKLKEIDSRVSDFVKSFDLMVLFGTVTGSKFIQ